MAEDAGVEVVGECHQLQVEFLTGDIGIGIHVKVEWTVELHIVIESLAVITAQECGRGDGYGFVPTGEHCPTVARALGDVEGLALAQHSQHRQIVYCRIYTSDDADDQRRVELGG